MARSALLPRFLHCSRPWAVAWLVWLIALWLLSGGPPPMEKTGLSFPFADKILHAGYFFGGTGLLCAALYQWKRHPIRGRHLFLTVFLAHAIVGLTDEIHQSFNPLRTGNDGADFAANLTGCLLGLLVFHRTHHLAFGPNH